jgi:Uma2 family endonuclease
MNGGLVALAPAYHEFFRCGGLMTLAATPESPPAEWDALAPLLLPPDLRLTPEQFAQVCAANPEAVLELAADGRLIPMTPTGSETGARNSRLVMRLLLWADQKGSWKVFDSSSGFLLPDGSVFSPDASLVRLECWQALTPEERRGFAPLCPDLLVELASPNDEGPRGVTALRRKMAAYQANGARLGWLLLPEQRAVEIWPAAGEAGSSEPQRIEQAEVLDAGPEFPGLRLELAEIWDA